MRSQWRFSVFVESTPTRSWRCRFTQKPSWATRLPFKRQISKGSWQVLVSSGLASGRRMEAWRSRSWLTVQAVQTNCLPSWTIARDLRVVGAIHAFACGGVTPKLAYPLPVPLGVSGGNVLLAGEPGSCASGTIGFKVRDNVTGAIGWVGNSHVVGHGANDVLVRRLSALRNINRARSIRHQYAVLVRTSAILGRTVPIIFGNANNLVDCGFVISSDGDVSSDILNLGPQVNNVVPAFVGQVVQKNGRTTSCTEGTVSGDQHDSPRHV